MIAMRLMMTALLYAQATMIGYLVSYLVVAWRTGHDLVEPIIAYALGSAWCGTVLVGIVVAEGARRRAAEADLRAREATLRMLEQECT